MMVTSLPSLPFLRTARRLLSLYICAYLLANGGVLFELARTEMLAEGLRINLMVGEFGFERSGHNAIFQKGTRFVSFSNVLLQISTPSITISAAGAECWN